MVTPYYDAHCHLFNARYLVMELLEVARQIQAGDYGEAAFAPVPTTGATTLSTAPPWQQVVDGILTLYHRCKSSCPQNYQYELDEWTDIGIGQPAGLRLVPLMMDIYYLLAARDAFDVADQPHVTSAGDGTALKPLAGALQNELVNGLAAVIDDCSALTEATTDVKNTITDYFDRLTGQHAAVHPELPVFAYQGMPVSPGYQAHMEELVMLEADHHGSVFPFLAIDPRRPKMKEFVTEGTVTYNNTTRRIISRSGPFYGIKIYPPLGYFPDQAELLPIYQFCMDNDLPVTSHCQPQSFYAYLFGAQQTPQGVYYAHPKNWAPLLTKQPYKSKLRLDLAHFGGDESVKAFAQSPSDPAAEWTQWVAKWITECDYVYTDSAAIADPSCALAVQHIVKGNTGLAKRVMFGSDYVINMFDLSLGGQLSAFFNQYTGLLPACFTDNVVAFLNARP